MNAAEQRAQQAAHRKIAALLVYEAKLKEHEAAVWLGLGNNIMEAASHAHSALDALLDATCVQIDAVKAQHGRPA